MVVSARDGAEGKMHRLYFLLGPGTLIPPIVHISHQGGKKMKTNPLPAIFSPELGASARSAGKKGVLHTIWGKQRLFALQNEIENEMKTNGEGIGLEMAMQEKQWIEDNFGVGAKATSHMSDSLPPSSPKTPGGGRLIEKLKGLKLGTTSSELNNRSRAATKDDVPKLSSHPLSPDTGDIAFSSFVLFHGGATRSTPKVVAQSPPDRFLAQQGGLEALNRMNSLDAVGGRGTLRPEEKDVEDDLFAVNISPRSPDMAKSPFSFNNVTEMMQ